MSISEKIGEGTYGCVHKPSLKCDKKPPGLPNYNDKISKLMESKEARDELKEFFNIKKIDPTDMFHSGTPVYCTPSNIKENIAAAKKCNIQDIKIATRNSNLKDTLALLVMNDGGKDLRKIIKDFKKLPLNENSKTKIHKFIISFERAFIALKELNDNGYVHNDLKTDNMVYNSDTNILNFIDFGLTKQASQIMHQCTKNYYYDYCHWNFVPEITLLNQERYERVRKLYTKNKYKSPFKVIYDNLFNERGSGWSDFALSEQYPTTSRSDMVFKFKTKYTQIIKTIEHICNQDHSFKKQHRSPNGLHNTSINSMDSYALGQSLSFCIYSLSSFFTPPYDNLKDQLLVLTEEMTTWNCFDRKNPQYYLNKFQEILKNTGILDLYSLEITDKPNTNGYNTIIPISKQAITLETIFKSPKPIKLPIKKIKKIRIDAQRPEAPDISSTKPSTKPSTQTKKKRGRPKKSKTSQTRKTDTYSQDKRWKGQQLRDRLASLRKTPKGKKNTTGLGNKTKKDDMIREIRRIEKEQGIPPKSVTTYL